MKDKKKFIRFLWMIPALIMCLVIGSVVAYAAMTVREEKVNFFQIGNFQTKIEEVFKEPTTISPNTSVEKKVTIKNTGSVDQFIRVMILPEIRLESGESNRLLPSKIGEEVLLDLNTTQWKLGEDGYYYYLNVLESDPSKVAENLFTKVTLKKELGQEYQNASFNLLVKVEAINCAKFAYRDAWWQGTTPNNGNLQIIDNQLAGKAK